MLLIANSVEVDCHRVEGLLSLERGTGLDHQSHQRELTMFLCCFLFFSGDTISIFLDNDHIKHKF